MTMPSVASLFGSDLVSGALRSTLNQVQKNCSFLNLKQRSKKERRKEKKLKRKLERRYGSFSRQPYQALLNNSSPLSQASPSSSFRQNPVVLREKGNVSPKAITVEDASNSDLSDTGGDLGESWMDENPPLEFIQEGPQSSALTLNLRDKYSNTNDTDGRMELSEVADDYQGNESPKIYGTVQEATDLPVSSSNTDVVEDELDIFSSAKANHSSSSEGRATKPNGLWFKTETSSTCGQESTDALKLPNTGKTVELGKIYSSIEQDSHNSAKDKEACKDKAVNNKCKGGDGVRSCDGGVEKKPVKLLVQTNLSGFLNKPFPQTPASKDSQKGGLKDRSKSSEPNLVKLPAPKVVLYDRKKIRPGWRTKMPIGCGFINLGNTCYMNATLQTLYHTPAFLNWLLDEINEKDHRDKCERNNQSTYQCTICPMASGIFGVYSRQGAPFRPVNIHNKLRTIGKNFSFGRQEDAHEFLRLLLESMERSYLTAAGGHRLDNRSKETTPLGQIFGGYTRGEVRCLTCRHVSTTFHPHAELQLDIREVNNVEDALAFYFQKEKLDNNDYKCEKCKTVQPATKQQFMELAPTVLCIQLKRFRACGSKIKKPIFINEKLNLSRFMYRRSERTSEAEYRLVGLVTHIGPSPNCGHYTAIAQASNGNYYQFDDSYVRLTNLNHAQNADAYVIIYETTNRSTLTPDSCKSTTPPDNCSSGKSSTSSIESPAKSVSSSDSPLQVAKVKPTPLETTSEPKSTSSTSTSSSTATKSEVAPKNFSPKSQNFNGKSSNISNKTFSNLVEKKPAASGNTMSFKIQSNTPPLGPSANIFSANSRKSPTNHLKNNTNRYFNQYGQKKPSSTKPLVPYAFEDEDDSDDDARKNYKSANGSNGTSVGRKASPTAVETNGRDSKINESSTESHKVYRPPTPPKIKSWSSEEESKLNAVLEADRKRPFFKSKEELEDEDIDAGRMKKKAKPEGPDVKPSENPFDKFAERYRKD